MQFVDLRLQNGQVELILRAMELYGYNLKFMVNDTDAASKALAEYESDKSKINLKEARIDQRMKNLETEQGAIKNMIESIKKIKNDNIDRTFKIFA